MTIIDRSRRSFADSGEHLRKGTVDYRRFRSPLIDSFLREVLGVEAELQGLSARLRETSSDGGLRSSGEVHRWCCRETRRGKTEGSRVLCGGGQPIIDVGGGGLHPRR
jgi:hypothetical protein